MVGKKTRRNQTQALSLIVLALLAFIFAYPFWQTLVLSFSDKAFANSPGFKFWPRTITLDAYRQVFSTDTIFVGYKNTIIRTVIGTVLTVSITFCAAFAISHQELPGRKFINFLVVFTMFFSGGIVPAYMNIKNLGLLNTRWVLILPLVASAWNFIILRNFITALGRDLEEAACIDGASPTMTMIRIIAPLTKSALSVIALWSVVNHWNAWYDSMVYANKKDLVVLQTVVRRLIDEGEETAAAGEAMTAANTATESVRAATVMIATAPILLGYPFIQKYLVKGTMIGALKG